MPILYTTPHKKVNENFAKFSLTNQGKIIMCGPKRKKYKIKRTCRQVTFCIFDKK